MIRLLGLLAYGNLQAFAQMAADANLAPDLRRRAVLSEMAAYEVANYRRLATRLEQLGADVEQAMSPFVEALGAYHDRTRPKDWLEALTKAYVGDAIADDFYQETAVYLDSPDRELVLEVLHESRYADFAAEEIRRAIDADPKVANRLSMWGRRLVGEALSQAQRVVAKQPALMELIMAHAIEPAIVLKRLTGEHSARMAAVGLNN